MLRILTLCIFVSAASRPNLQIVEDFNTLSGLGIADEKSIAKFLQLTVRMEKSLEAGNCQHCFEAYFKSIAMFKNSADESLTDDLARLIRRYPDRLNSACRNLTKDARAGVRVFFPLALANVASESASLEKAMKAKVKDCWLGS